MRNLKSILETLSYDKNEESLKNLITALKNDLKKFEKEYNMEYHKMIIGSSFSRMINKCDEYNNLIDKYQANLRKKEEMEYFLNLKKIIDQKYIARKDCHYLRQEYVFFDNQSFQKVEYIQKDEYISKYIDNFETNEIKYFEKITVENIENKFKPLIEKLKEINNMMKSLNKTNVNELNKLNPLLKLIEEKSSLFVINFKCERFIVEKIFDQFNVNIDIQSKNILSQINNVCLNSKSILQDLDLYNKDEDISLIERMKKESLIYLPNENTLQSIKNNKKEFISIRYENNIIPYYTNQNNNITGCEEIKYDLGTLSLNDPEYQKIYFASFDENIKSEIAGMNNDDVDLIKRKKLFALNLKIKEKREEKTEVINNSGSIKLNFGGKNKLIKYQISYQLEAMNIYLKCDKYKLKYLGKSTFY